jgi:hypothetical protein
VEEVLAEHSEPFTVMERTLFPVMPPPPAVTFSVVKPEMLPDAAVIVVVPAAIEAALPFEPAVLLIVATDISDEVQVTDVVRSFVEWSEYEPVAANCLLVPIEMLGFGGATVIDTSVFGAGTGPELEPPPLQPVISATIRIKSGPLLDIIDAYSLRD